MIRLILIVTCVAWTVNDVLADPIRFDNPDTPDRFNWGPEEELEEIAIDMRAPFWEQPGTAETRGSIQQIWESSTPFTVGFLERGFLNHFNEVTAQGDFVLPVEAGTVIGPDYPWGGETDLEIYREERTTNNEVIVTTLIPEGEPVYLGVRWFNADFTIGYGWIGVVRTTWRLDAFAWGYETQPDVGIPAGAVPEPASLLALLALGFVAARRR